MNVLFLVAGLALLVFGAEMLVRGVSTLARAMGVPPLVIGLTVVAFGTSVPELTINTLAAMRHDAPQMGLAFGNIIGACTVNIGIVLSLSALVRPLTVGKSVIVREIPMMILAVTALAVLSADRRIDTAEANQLAREDGLILLLLFCVFVYYLVKDLLVRQRETALPPDRIVTDVKENIQAGKGLGSTGAHETPLWLSGMLTIGGLCCVALGGGATVDGAMGLASALGVPQVIIGFTLVSFGTTLPELATSIAASRRGQSDLAIGNVVGSNIFNILFIGGVSSTISPLPIPRGGVGDVLFLMAMSILLLPVAIRGPRMITRAEGVVLLCIYLTYAVWRTMIAT
jgi:cation:H+ antiporter